MYFHSSGSRRDHYATLRNQHQVFKRQQQEQQPRSATSSTTVSGTDSGYHSPSSSPTPRPIKKDQHDFGTNQDHHDNASTTYSFVTDSTTTSTKKIKRTAKKHLDHHHSRHLDLVYSSPRPLAFPFHNDCHFLPVAEADPRDIARIAPPPPLARPSSSFRRNISINSNKTASSSSSSWHLRTSISSIPEGSNDTLSHTTNDSRPASLINSVQQGTVRSLRSFFQMGGQPQHHPTAHNSKRLLALEPKTGTVASLRQLFSRPPSSYADLEAEPIIQTTASNSQSHARTKSLFFGKQSPSTQRNRPPQLPPPSSLPSPPPPSSLPSPPLPSSSSSRFTLSRLWSSKKLLDELPKPPSTPPRAKSPSPTPSLSTGLKRLFTRPVDTLPPPTPSISPTPPISPTPARHFLTSFRRASRRDTGSQVQKKQHMPRATTINDTLATPPPPSTTVGRIWKNFKRLVNGNKVSRIGVL